MTTVAASSQTTERSLDRPVMTLDLPAILGSMKQEETWRTAQRNSMTLVKQPIFRIVLVALQAGAEIGAHETEGPVTVHAIEGRLAIHVGMDEFALSAGQLLILSPGMRHSMYAHDDAAFLLTLTAEGLHPGPNNSAEPTRKGPWETSRQSQNGGRSSKRAEQRLRMRRKPSQSRTATTKPRSSG